MSYCTKDTWPLSLVKATFSPRAAIILISLIVSHSAYKNTMSRPRCTPETRNVREQQEQDYYYYSLDPVKRNTPKHTFFKHFSFLQHQPIKDYFRTNYHYLRPQKAFPERQPSYTCTTTLWPQFVSTRTLYHG